MIFDHFYATFQADLAKNNDILIDHFVDRQKAQNGLTKYPQRLSRETLSSQQRKAQMNGVNPKFILRNYLAQVAIDRAEEGDFSESEQLLSVLSSPYSEQFEHA